MPQGALFSHPLCIIGVNNLPNAVPPLISKALFAYDFCIFISCKQSKLGENSLYQGISQMQCK